MTTEINKENERVLNLPENVTVNFTWSPSKDSASRTAEATFDLSKLSAQDILDYAMDSITIKLQGTLRRTFGTDKWEVPSTVERLNAEGVTNVVETYKIEVAKPGERKSADPVKRLAKDIATSITASGMTLDELKALTDQILANRAKKDEEKEMA